MEGSLPRLFFLLADPEDRAAVAEALAALHAEIGLDLVPDGPGLRRHLAAGRLPDLLFMDLAEAEGLALLAELRADPRTRGLVVIGLSRSWSQPAMDRAYRGGANAWMTMPLTHTELLDLLHRCLDFWLGAAQLPSRPEP